MRLRTASGFTLVEVMIVVTIIGVLAAVAIPSYQNYALRAKVSEAILALSTCRGAVSEVYQGASTSAPGANNWGCESGVGTSKYVGAISTSDNGTIVVTLRNVGPADGNTLTLTPLVSGGAAADATTDIGRGLYGWRCGVAADGTTLNRKYLPGSCRS
ncbi:MAG: pilin [Burkholderiales bacterium]